MFLYRPWKGSPVVKKFPFSFLRHIHENFSEKYSAAEQQTVLHVLNDPNSETLSRFKINRTKLHSLEKVRSERGPFATIVEVLQVNGLGPKSLQLLCDSILNADKGGELTNGNMGTETKSMKRQLLWPALNCANTLKSAVALYIGPIGVGWAKLCKDKNTLDCWSFHNFDNLPKKLISTDTFYLANAIINSIPLGDVYVFEAAHAMSPQGSKQLASVTSYNQQMELMTMLLALINTSPKCGAVANENEGKIEFENQVYFLRNNLSARLFNTLVGNERVSAEATIGQLLESMNAPFSLPCTPLTIDANLRYNYHQQSPVYRELMGQSLMLAIAFMDLCIYRNPDSYGAITPRKRSN